MLLTRRELVLGVALLTLVGIVIGRATVSSAARYEFVNGNVFDRATGTLYTGMVQHSADPGGEYTTSKEFLAVNLRTGEVRNVQVWGDAPQKR